MSHLHRKHPNTPIPVPPVVEMPSNCVMDTEGFTKPKKKSDKTPREATGASPLQGNNKSVEDLCQMGYWSYISPKNNTQAGYPGASYGRFICTPTQLGVEVWNNAGKEYSAITSFATRTGENEPVCDDITVSPSKLSWSYISYQLMSLNVACLNVRGLELKRKQACIQDDRRLHRIHVVVTTVIELDQPSHNSWLTTRKSSTMLVLWERGRSSIVP